VVGRLIRGGNFKRPPITVIGVVQDVRSGTADDMLPIIYRPYPQWASREATLVFKTGLDPSAVAPAVRAAVRKMNANLPIPAMRTMREIVSESVAERRFQMTLTILFAVLALLLGAVGVYGVVSYSVTSRTREIGLRLALGARKGDVIGWVFGRGMRPVVAGLAVGLAGSFVLAMTLRRLLFGITPADPMSFGSVIVVLLLASGLACYLPARRAAGMDPMTALRHE